MNERGCEHPTINRKFVGKKYEFTYVIGWLESVNKGTVPNTYNISQKFIDFFKTLRFDKIFKPQFKPIVAEAKNS